MEYQHYTPPTHFSNHHSVGMEFTEEEYETLRHLGDHGLLLVVSFPGHLYFGVRVDGAKGHMPFRCESDGDSGCKDILSSGDFFDRIDVAHAQNWSILKAYQLGLEAGRREVNSAT